MINIYLLCQYGASTGMLSQKIRQAAKDKGIDIKVEAYSYSDADEIIDKADVILLGPQIRFKLDEFTEKYGNQNVPFFVIDTIDYGMMNGENVLNNVLKALNK